MIDESCFQCQQIEVVRKELNIMVKDLNFLLLHPELQEKSKELDQLILHYYQDIHLVLNNG